MSLEEMVAAERRRESITQRLRDLITEDGSKDEIQNELMEVERRLQLPLTEPSMFGTMTLEELAQIEEPWWPKEEQVA